MVINSNEEWLNELNTKLSKIGSLVFDSTRSFAEVKITREEFRAIYLDEECYISFIENASAVGTGFAFQFWLDKYPECADEILNDSPFDEFRMWTVENGYCNDLSIYDEFADSDDLQVRMFGVKMCSLEKLESILEFEEDKLVRIKIYDRLGPAACLDRMLEDRSFECRLKGVELAPYGYPKLEDMIDDASKHVFKEVAKKIDEDLLPFLLRSKHIEDPKVLELIDRRLDGEIIIDIFNDLMEK